MPRRKKCIKCGEELVCKACGTAQNPPKKGKGPQFLMTGLSEEQIAELDAEAKTRGISRNQLIRERAGLESEGE